jgi:PhzF family phenazine biosynthesis protein
MVGLEEADLAGEPLWIDTGVTQLVIPVATVAAVRRAIAVPALIAQHGLRPGGSEAMAYVWAREEGAPDRIVVRFFFTQDGAIVEDPATGSACANLGGYLLASGLAPPFAATLRQGDAVQRPSRLDLRVDEQRRIHVTGSVVELGGGHFAL